MKDNLHSIIIGPLPPPIGGVSNHIQRYSVKNNIQVFSEKKTYTFKDIKYILLLKNTHFHVHTASWRILLLLVLKGLFFNRKCKYSLINHNFKSLIEYKKSFKSLVQFYIRKQFIKNCIYIYIVNPELISKMQNIYGKHNYLLFDPFVPPNISNEDNILKSYDNNLHNFLNTNTPIISSGAWQLSMHEGEDLYGFDLLITMLAELKKEFPKIGLFFFIGNPDYNSEYLGKCKSEIEKLCLSQNLLLVTGQKELWPVIKRSNLFIRATSTDGDPLSVKEALYFGIDVLASDCTKRENRVAIFKSRNTKSLTKNAMKLLKINNRQ